MIGCQRGTPVPLNNVIPLPLDKGKGIKGIGLINDSTGKHEQRPARNQTRKAGKETQEKARANPAARAGSGSEI